jgi:phosphopentomutase
MKENSLIVYTSADSVLQIAAHEEVTGKEELYRCCEIARKSAWRRNISSAGSSPVLTSAPIKMTSNGSSATGATMPFRLRARRMDLLEEEGLMTSCIGKISDIFDDVGVTKTVHTVSNEDGMDKTIAAVKAMISRVFAS